jgi:hypothetical protein
MNYQIDCQDIYNGIDSLIPMVVKAAGNTYGPMIKNLWTGLPDTTACTNTSGKIKLGHLCVLINAAAKPIQKAGIDPNVLTVLCKNLLDDCHPTFCSKGKEVSTIEIPCDELKDLIHIAFQNPIVKTEIKKKVPFVLNEQNYCQLLAKLAKGDVDNLIKLIISEIKDKGGEQYTKHKSMIDKYVERLKTPLKCLCPHIEDSPPPVPPAPHPDPSKKVAKPGYNKVLIIGTLLALSTLALIPFFGVLIGLKPLGKKLLVLFLIIALVFFITAVIVWVNPRGIYKSIVKNSDDWIPVEGKFKGETNLYGVKVVTEIETDKNNNVKLEILTCDGKGCPDTDKNNHSDLIKNCKNKTIKISNTKTPYGYPLVGECIDELFKIKTLDGKPAVRGLWLIRNNMNIEVQIYLHIGITKDYTIDQVIRIPVKKALADKTV